MPSFATSINSILSTRPQSAQSKSSPMFHTPVNRVKIPGVGIASQVSLQSIGWLIQEDLHFFFQFTDNGWSSRSHISGRQSIVSHTTSSRRWHHIHTYEWKPNTFHSHRQTAGYDTRTTHTNVDCRRTFDESQCERISEFTDSARIRSLSLHSTQSKMCSIEFVAEQAIF